METKKCLDCGEIKPVLDFNKGTNGAKYLPRCKSCWSKKQAQDYKDRWFIFFCRGKKSESKKKGLDFNLDADFLESIYTDFCPVFNVPFRRHEKTHPHCPTLDRVDPSKGYTKGNVVWISSRANRIKYDSTTEEIKKVLEYMETH